MRFTPTGFIGKAVVLAAATASVLTTLQSGRLGTVDWGLLEAGVVVTMLPCILLFLALQRYYVRGLVAGAVK